MTFSVRVQELKFVGSDLLEIDLCWLVAGAPLGLEKSPCLQSLTLHVHVYPSSVSLIVTRCGVMLAVLLGFVAFACLWKPAVPCSNLCMVFCFCVEDVQWVAVQWNYVNNFRFYVSLSSCKLLWFFLFLYVRVYWVHYNSLWPTCFGTHSCWQLIERQLVGDNSLQRLLVPATTRCATYCCEPTRCSDNSLGRRLVVRWWTVAIERPFYVVDYLSPPTLAGQCSRNGRPLRLHSTAKVLITNI